MTRSAEYLYAKFNSRKIRNARYSLRAFSSQLGIHSGRVSQFFSGERLISPSMARSLAEKLGLDDAETEYFEHLAKTDKENAKSAVRNLAEDELALIVEWYHASILALLKTDGFKSDSQWIAKKMNLPIEIINASLERMERLGLITNSKKGWRRTAGPISTTVDVPSSYLRLSHKDLIGKIINEMDAVAPENREISSITFPMSPAKLPSLKKELRDLSVRLANKASRGKKSDVYSFSLQLFPLTKVD